MNSQCERYKQKLDRLKTQLVNLDIRGPKSIDILKGIREDIDKTVIKMQEARCDYEMMVLHNTKKQIKERNAKRAERVASPLKRAASIKHK
jgi:hypothetical protein